AYHLILPSFPTRRSSDLAVLRLVRKGHTNQEIADLLAISRETVRWYLRELGSKVGRTVREPLADAQAASAGTAPVLVRYTPERSDRKSTRLNSSHQIISY